MTNDKPLHTGLYDRDGQGIVIGSIVARPVTVNQELHGEWAEYEVQQRGLTPILSYVRSAKGRVLPTGYLACPLHEAYDAKLFLFATDLSKLRPTDGMHVVWQGDQ